MDYFLCERLAANYNRMCQLHYSTLIEILQRFGSSGVLSSILAQIGRRKSGFLVHHFWTLCTDNEMTHGFTKGLSLDVSYL